MQTLFHGSVDNTTEEIEVPAGASSFFLNLSSLVGLDSRITDGSHDRDHVIRTATISQKDKIMTMTLFMSNNSSRGRAEVSVEWEEDGVKRNKTFGVVVGGEATTTHSNTITTSTPEMTAPQTETSATGVLTQEVQRTGQPQQRDLLWHEPQQQDEDVDDDVVERIEDVTMPLHPMGIGERVGTSKYPWQQHQHSSRRLLDV